MSANDKILVAHASKYGATAEIAEKIGEVLGGEGLQVEVMSVKKVKDTSPYRAVVLGSAAYIGGWRKEAVAFLRDNEKLLAGRPVWLFSSGPAGEGDPVELLKGWRFPEKVRPVIDVIKPRDITVFHGVVDPEKMNVIEKQMMKMVKSPAGDYRDWDAITAWAMAIAGELKKPEG